jgi:prevent-host-death family protein
MMIDLHNIHSLTDFKRNANAYVEQVQTTQLPLVLTVNGKAAVVVQEAGAFQSQIDRLKSIESELRSLKLAELRREIDIGIQQSNRGEYTEYSLENLHELFDEIKAEGRASLEKTKAES